MTNGQSNQNLAQTPGQLGPAFYATAQNGNGHPILEKQMSCLRQLAKQVTALSRRLSESWAAMVVEEDMTFASSAEEAALEQQAVDLVAAYPARTERHFRRLLALIREYLDALDAGRFNYRPGFSCGFCDYRDGPCRQWQS